MCQCDKKKKDKNNTHSNDSDFDPDRDRVEYKWDRAFNSLCNNLFFKWCNGSMSAYFVDI